MTATKYFNPSDAFKSHVFEYGMNTANVSSTENYQALTDHFTPQASNYEVQKLSANLKANWAAQHAGLATFCKMWAERHGYGLAEINQLLDIIHYAKSNLNGKLSLELGLDDIMLLWIAASLEKRFPDEEIEAYIGEVSWEFNHYSITVWADILQNLSGLSSTKQLVDILNFVQEYRIPTETFARLLSGPIHVGKLYQNLVIFIFKKALPRNFHFSRKAIEAAYQLMVNKWHLPQILGLFNVLTAQAGDKTHDFQAIAVLENIVNYQLAANDHDQQHRTIKEILTQVSSQNWLYEIGKMIVFLRFSSAVAEQDSPEIQQAEKKVFALLTRVLELNQDNPDLINLMINDRFKTLLLSYEDDSVCSTIVLLDKPIHSWESVDIALWRFTLSTLEAPVTFTEKLAVIKRAVFLAHGYLPRSVQVLAASLLYHGHTGMLAEIATGEGKSIIAAMFAVMKVLDGKKVDIVTSSPVLAQRDAIEQANFYNLFGITVADNLERAPVKACYGKDIIYGDVLNFVADILDKDEYGHTKRGKRALDVVMIDEVDSAFVDQSAHLTQLSRNVASFEYLEPMLAALWKQLEQINGHLAYDNGLQKLLWIDGPFEYEAGRVKLLTDNSQAYYVEDRFTFTKALLQDYLDKLITGAPPILHMPNALRSFVDFQKNNWIESAITASYLTEGKNYVVSQDEYGNGIISTVDYKNTGVVHKSMQWSDGLHQFLQIKHGVKITAESLLSQFMSNMAFFKSYQAGVYGMTGTLGSEYEKEFIKAIYGASTFKLPTYRPKRFLELPHLVADSQAKWVEEILAVIVKESRRGRAVLLILETINEVNWLADELKGSGYPKHKIRVYSRNDQLVDIGHSLVDIADVIIATNLAGRGTDLKTTEALDKNGGLHVCVGYLPSNLRVQLQAYGRTARQGNRGTAQLVINKPVAVSQLQSSYAWYLSERETGDLLEWRDLAERERLIKDRYMRNAIIALKDALFAQFTQFIEEVRSSSTNPIDTLYEIKQIEDLWGMWLKQQQGSMEHTFNSKIQDKDIEILQQKNAEIKTKVFASFQEFIKNLRKDYQEKSILKNPGYLAQKAWDLSSTNAKQALAYVDRAKLLDPIYSFGATYTKAFIIARTRHEAKQEIYDNLLATRHTINTYILPQLEGMLTVLNLNAIHNNDNELSKQLISKMAVFRKMDEYINNAMERIAKSKPEEKIKVKSLLGLQQIMQWQEDQENEVLEFKEIGIPALFEVDTYKKKKNWIGTVVAFAAGIVQIVIGVYMAPFSAGLSASIIASGISDIISAVKSVVTGQPIDLDQYFTAKGIEYAVIIVSAGINSAKDALTGAKQVGAKAASTEASKQISKKVLIEEVKKELVKRGISTGLAYVAEKVLNKGLKHYEGDIASHVQKAIDKLFITYPQEIGLALFYDEMVDSPDRQNTLYQALHYFLTRHQDKYHTATASIAKGVGANMAYEINPAVGVGYTAVNMGYSLAKIEEVTEEITAQLSEYLQTKAQEWTKPDDVMELRLSNFFTKEQAKDITTTLTTHQVIVNHQVVNCNGIKEEHVQAYKQHLQKIVHTCHPIEAAVKSDKSARIDEMKKSYVGLITSSIMKRLQGEIISPLASMVGMWGGNKLFNSLQKAQEEVIDKFSERAPRYLVEERNAVQEPAVALNEPAVTLEPARPLLYEEQARVALYTKEIFKDHGNGFLDAELLSRALKKDIHLYTDGLYERSFTATVGNEDGYRLHYDSHRARWATYLPNTPDTPYSTDSIYDAMALQTGLSVKQLRDIVGQYVQSYPHQAHQLLTTYKADASYKLKEKPKTPTKKPPATPTKVPSTEANHPSHKTRVDQDKPMMNTVWGKGFKYLGAGWEYVEEKGKEMGAHLEAHHPSVYKVGGKVVGWITYGLEKIGEGTDELMRITAETSWSAIGQKPGFANQARDYTLGSIGQYLEENTDQQFQKGVGVAAAAAAWIPGLRGIAKRVPSPISKEAFENLIQSKVSTIKSKLDQGIFGKIISKPSSIEDVARQWNTPAIKPTQFEITIQGKTFKADSKMNPNGVPVIVGASDKQVKNYAFNLMQSIGAKKFPKVTHPTGKGEFYIYKNPDTKVSITLRSESKSVGSTGAKWTIDINKHPNFPKDDRVEIKFK
jgi:hypothetical protein